ncbi:MAG: ATP-binding protein [Microcoleus sp.]
MDIEKVLKLADDLVFAKTGSHLDYLQEAILKGSLQAQTYSKIAEQLHLSKSHVRNTGSEIWKILSEELKQDITKTSFRSVLESSRISQNHNQNNISFVGETVTVKESLTVNNLNICPTTPRSPTASQNTQATSKNPCIDLTEAPTPNNFYDRTSELSTLKQWILQAHTRLITVYGLSGIGKSAIALKLIEQTQTEFDYIIWLSLTNTPTLSTLQTELKQFFGRSQQTPLPTIIDYFRTSRCLVILDDVQNIFRSSQLAGQYLAGYEDYSKFFKQIATSSHQSSLILLSWEKPREITALEAENRATRTLHLKGLGEKSAEILREKGLADEEKWSELIALYQGHPSWLNIIAATIWELFDGSVSLFLADGNDLFLGDLELLLESHLERLSDSEKKALYWLATQNEAVDISRQPADSLLSKSEFWQAIQSLARRGLVEKVLVGGRSKFQINPVFQQYIQSK